MLQTFDTLIAFAVIMTVLSLLITIVVQMLSAALSLRGKNLANALSLTFQTIDPKLQEHAYALAEYILKDPIFSDSIFRTKDRKATAGLPELRAAENLFAQAQKTALAAMGTAGHQAATTSLQQAQEALEKASKTALRTEPWGFWHVRKTMTLASAVRPGEVYRVLHELKDLTTADAMERGIPLVLKINAGKLLSALRVPDGPALEAEEKLAALAQLATKFSTSEQQKALLDALSSFGATVERASTQAYDRFQRWFGSAQDRAEQWFQLHIRGITIAAASLMAFTLQLDTIHVFRQLRSQPEMVATLVKTVAPAVLEQGQSVLDSGDTQAYHAYRVWLLSHPLYPLATLPSDAALEQYVAALKSRLKEAPASPESSQLVGDFLIAAERELASIPADNSEASRGAALAGAYERWAKAFPLFRLAPATKLAQKVDAIAVQIGEKIRKVHDEQLGAEAGAQQRARDLWLAEYESLFASGRPFLEARRKTAETLRGALESTGFDILPKRFMGRWAEEPARWGWKCQWLAQFWAHFFGTFVTAGFLALGAPFWFNLLKNLMSLRPAVATLIERRPQSAPALPSSPTTPVPSN